MSGIKKTFAAWGQFDSGISLAGYLWAGFSAISGLSAAGLMGWVAATTDWYWDTYGRIGVGFAGLMAFVLVCFSFAAVFWALSLKRQSHLDRTPKLNKKSEAEKVEVADTPLNLLSAFQRPRDQVIDDLESHNAELQKDRDGLRKQVENMRAGMDVLVKDIRLGRADDVTSRYWLNFEAAHFVERLDVCLDLQALTWTIEKEPRGFSWSRKTRHVVRSCRDVVGGRTFSIQVVEDRPSMFEANAPHWFVGENSVDGSGWIPAPSFFQRAAFVFIANGKEQAYKAIVLPRLPSEALCIIDEPFFETATFWDANERHLTLRSTRGLRERITPEAKTLR